MTAPVSIAEGIWLIRLPLPFPVAILNVYLIRTDDGFLLLDCGLKTNACRKALAEALASIGVQWTQIRRLIITHLHPDHFGLAAEVRERSANGIWMHKAEAALLSPRFMDNDLFSEQSAWLIENGAPRDATEEIAQASQGISEFIDMFSPDGFLEDGDRIPVQEGEIEALLTPGHSPGLLTFYFAGRKLYFSSDHMVEKITPNVGLHGHSSENPLGDYLASLKRVRELDIDWVLPSHGQPFRGHRDWICATMQHHEARCRRMQATVAEAPRTAYEVAAAEWGRHLSPLNERFAMAEALAHLEYLRRQGRVAVVRDGPLIRWRAVSQ